MKRIFSIYFLLFSTIFLIFNIPNFIQYKNSYTFETLHNKDKIYVEKNNLKPQIKFTKWNEEASLILESLDLDFSDIKIENSDDMFKMIFNFKEKPANNKFSFRLINWENFDFFYQPPLANINSDGSTWEKSKNGRIFNRPANVNGSYAVYHKTKKDHIEGQTNYETGKFLHIYRPKLFDAVGKIVLADLDISDGIYIVTIPQSFLDNAIYPIKSNDTFGYTSIGASSTSAGGNYRTVTKANSTPVSNGTLTSISLYCNIDSGAPQFWPALYSDSAGEPNTLLASAQTGTSIGVSAGWVTSSLSYGSITSGTQYWLGDSSASSTFYFEYYDSGGSLRWTNPVANWENPWDTVNDFNEIFKTSIYATYTPSAGGARRVINVQ